MISVSDLSYLGLCQIAFLFNKKAKIVTQAMMQGAKRHSELHQQAEFFTQDEIIEKTIKGERFVAREVSVADYEAGIRGRIDEMEFMGHNESKKNAVIIRDDKFSRSNFLGMNDMHRIQLTSYAFMTPRDPKFRDMVEVAGASIRFRKFNSPEHTEFKVSGRQLSLWAGDMPMLTALAGNILENREMPKPRSFAMMDSEWLPISKQTCASCKYNKVCSVGRKMLAK
ncbi:MAG: PD-(D/E)XK nuclease family protein [Candidatus Aenigmarchaeota archaeon]|nr:PD-(D/E)XK nuclease family protein [Candidatus Aenigmarchaeota archaeon]